MIDGVVMCGRDNPLLNTCRRCNGKLPVQYLAGGEYCKKVLG